MDLSDWEKLMVRIMIVAGCVCAGVLSAETRRDTPSAPLRVAVFRQADLPVFGTRSSPEVLARALRRNGCTVAFIDADQLARGDRLTPSRFQVLILPYGGSFPLAAREAFLGYLRAGGNFVSLGGYAFENLLDRVGDTWVSSVARVEEKQRLALTPEKQLLADPGFERSIDAPLADARPGFWQRRNDDCRIVHDHPFEGKCCALVQTDTGATWTATVKARPHARYRLVGHMRCRGVAGRGFAYVAVYQYAADQTLVHWENCIRQTGTVPDWQAFSQDIIAHDGAATLRIYAGIWSASGEAWFDDIRFNVIPPPPPRINTSMGGRGGAGSVGIPPTSLPIFDSQHPLDRVVRLRPAPRQFVMPASATVTVADVDLDGTFRGWAATALTHNGRARWVPLLAGFDRLGRPRGPVGAMLLHRPNQGREPYRGSLWAFFGVDNADVFDGRNPGLMEGLVRTVHFLARGLFLLPPRTNFVHVRDGEPVRLMLTIANVGDREQRGDVAIRIRAAGEPAILFTQSVSFTAPATGEKAVAAVWHPEHFDADLYEVSCILRVDGHPIDEVEVGFTAQSPDVLASGPKLEFRDDYVRLDGKPVFLLGADDILAPRNPDQHPGVWAEDLRAARDYGLRLFETLPFFQQPRHPSDGDLRAYESQAQLTQKFGLVYMPGLLIGHNVMADAETLAGEAKLCRRIAARLKATPALIWYFNGDIVLDYGKAPEASRHFWNEYLRRTYGTDERLSAAWGRAGTELRLGALACPPPSSSAWDDRAALDLSRFDVWMAQRWFRTQEEAIRSEDVSHPTCSEFPPAPGRVDMLTMLDGNDMADCAAWATVDKVFNDMPRILKWNDMRHSGHSAAVGEYGFPTHPAYYPPELRTPAGRIEARRRRVQHTICLSYVAFAMGYSRIQQWCFKDFSAYIMPWGAFYMTGQLPKPETYANRNASLLLSAFAPVRVCPPVTLLLPDGMRQGVGRGQGLQAGLCAIDALLALHGDFDVLNDSRIASLSSAARLVIYPVPFCADERVAAALEKFVRAGGHLVMTGDLGFDVQRRPSPDSGLARLAGVSCGAPRYADVQWRRSEPVRVNPVGESLKLPPYTGYPRRVVIPRQAKVLATAEKVGPVITERGLGRGAVLFSSDPYELWAGTDKRMLTAFYREALRWGGVSVLPLEDPEGNFYGFRQPTRDGGCVWVVYNRGRGRDIAAVRLRTRVGSATLYAQGESPALLALDGHGKIVAAAGSGRMDMEGKTLLRFQPAAETDFPHIALRSLDGEDLRTSKAVMILPTSPGVLTLNASERWDGPVLLVGEFHRARWRTLERVRVGASPSIPIDADRAASVLVLCESSGQSHWEQRLRLP